MKKFFLGVIIPIWILAINSFEVGGFIVLAVYLLFYYLLSGTKESNNSNHQSPFNQKPNIQRKTKFDLSKSEFEREINVQLDLLRGQKTKIFWVGQEHRTHPWSLRPGGCTVIVLFKDRTCLGYDRVKRPDRYTMKISRDYILNHFNSVKHTNLEAYIQEIYLTSYSGIDLKKVWDTNTGLSPWQILEKYRTQ